MIDFKTFLQCASDTIYNLIKEREGRPLNKSSLFVYLFGVFRSISRRRDPHRIAFKDVTEDMIPAAMEKIKLKRVFLNLLQGRYLQ